MVVLYEKAEHSVIILLLLKLVKVSQGNIWQNKERRYQEIYVHRKKVFNIVVDFQFFTYFSLVMKVKYLILKQHDNGKTF